MNKHYLTVQRAYVALFMRIIAEGLESISKVDEKFQYEMQGFDVGYTIGMNIYPDGAHFTVQVTPEHTFKQVDLKGKKADLQLTVKHVSHAFAMFTMRESTVMALVNNRLIADGDVGKSIRFVRCLDRMESLIMPKLVAELAVKRYPTDLHLQEKLPKALRIYAGIARGIVQSLIRR